jgi:hypothetical protein
MPAVAAGICLALRATSRRIPSVSLDRLVPGVAVALAVVLGSTAAAWTPPYTHDDAPVLGAAHMAAWIKHEHPTARIIVSPFTEPAFSYHLGEPLPCPTQPGAGAATLLLVSRTRGETPTAVMAFIGLTPQPRATLVASFQETDAYALSPMQPTRPARGTMTKSTCLGGH